MFQSQGFGIGESWVIPSYLDLADPCLWADHVLAIQFFAQQHPRWTGPQHWTLGVVTSILFFSSVVFHELAHSVVAQHYKIKVLSITLFLFGGLARIARDPSQAIQEFNIAVAGPLASAFLAGVVYWRDAALSGQRDAGRCGQPTGAYKRNAGGFSTCCQDFRWTEGGCSGRWCGERRRIFARATRVAGASGKADCVWTDLPRGVERAAQRLAKRFVDGIPRVVSAERGTGERGASDDSGDADGIVRFRCDEPGSSDHSANTSLEEYSGEVLRRDGACTW